MAYLNPILRAFNNAQPISTAEAMSAFLADEESEGNENVCPNLPARKRALQCVSTKAQRVKVLKWMEATTQERGCETHIVSLAVKQFPEIFRAPNVTANIVKCARWWRERDDILTSFETDKKSISHRFLGARKRVSLKCGPGRGRKPADWISWIYPIVREDFDRLKKAGLKFSPKVLLLVARNCLLTTPHPCFSPNASPDGDSRPLMERITPRWVQQFQETHQIVHRTQTGKLMVSPAKLEFIERSVAFHMGVLRRGFHSGEFHEDFMENMDETHFQINMDNGRTLGFTGDKEVKYADIVSGGVGITMVVKVTGGVAGKIGMPFMIFMNPASSYPIRGVPDDTPGVCYRTAPKGFMTSQVLTEYYKEPRVSYAHPSGKVKLQWIDNAPGHKVVPECVAALERIKVQLRHFPENSTHLTQPADSFVISKIKDAWTRRWEEKKMEMLRDGQWQGDGRPGTSGMLKNPGKKWFLELAAACVRDVNRLVDTKYGISYARKAMIRCGLSLGLNGVWEEEQLSPQLQKIVDKYRRNFDGFQDGIAGVEGDGSAPVNAPLVENDILHPGLVASSRHSEPPVAAYAVSSPRTGDGLFETDDQMPRCPSPFNVCDERLGEYEHMEAAVVPIAPSDPLPERDDLGDSESDESSGGNFWEYLAKAYDE